MQQHARKVPEELPGRVIRTDHWAEHGDAILIKMLEADAHVYPAEEVPNMLQLVVEYEGTLDGGYFHNLAVGN